MIKKLSYLFIVLFIIFSGLYITRRIPYTYTSDGYDIYLIYQKNVKEIEISQMAFRCGGVEKINIKNKIVYGQIVVLADTRMMTDSYPDLKEFKEKCDGYFIIDVQNKIKSTGLSKIEYDRKLKEEKINKEAIDFYKFISKNGERID